MHSRPGAKPVAVIAAIGLVSALLTALPATGLTPAEPADAATISCSQLAIGQPCTVRYEDYPGQNQLVIPGSVSTVTVMLAGGSGAGGGDQGDPGPGGIVIATLEVSIYKTLDVWLADEAHGRTAGTGWADGGEGGQWNVGNDGYGGGGASALAYSAEGLGDPLIVAGGGGGGAGNVVHAYQGGGGGYGGNPAGDGANGQGEVWGPGGGGGSESGHHGGAGGTISDNTLVGSGGGGGGGGYHGGGGGSFGSFAPQFGFSSGGGGGGGSSWTRGDVEALGNGAAPLGAGWVTLLPGTASRYECTGNAGSITIPDDVFSYAVIAVGGAGSPGNSKARGGHGAVVSGVLDVSGLDILHYWVGCGGQASGHLSGWGWARGAAGGDAPSPEAKDGGHGGGATAVASPVTTPLVVAGGGGGAGGDIANCDDAPGSHCGGRGGSGGGTPGSDLPLNGADGDSGDGGDGGKGDHNYDHGVPQPNGDEGVSPACCDESGGGGGGGAGYPMGGEGGHHSTWAAGGGGGAGGSYFNSQRMSGGSIATSGDEAHDGHDANGYLLLLPIVSRVVDLTVSKAVTGAADQYAQGPFAMDVDCTLGGHPVVEESFQLALNGSHTLKVPEESDCTVNETVSGGASGPAPPHTVHIEKDPVAVVMTNTYAATSLTITVKSEMVDEDGQPTDDVSVQVGSYSVLIQCNLDGHWFVMPAPVVNGAVTVDGDAAFGPAGVSVTIPGLPVGALCMAGEQPDSGATRTSYLVDGQPIAGGAPFPLAAGANTFSVGNAYDLAPLSIEKVADGDGPVPPGAEFSGTVACTFHGSPVTFTTAPTFTGLTMGGTVEVHNLPVGAHCTVDETGDAGATAVTYTPAATVPITETGTSMVITNVFDTGTLIVRATSTGAGIAWANTDLTLHVVCTDEAIPATVLDDTFTTPPGGGWKSYTVDENMVCTVTETVTGGATAVSYWSSADPAPSTDPVEVTVGATPVTLEVGNIFEAAPLDVSVLAGGAGAGFADPSAVTVDGCTFNGLPIEIAPGAASVTFSFAPAGGESGIPLLVAGASCLVTLSNTGGATTATIDLTNAAPSTPSGTWAVRVTVNPPGTAVQFDTEFDVAALTVEKELVGPGAWASNVPYLVELTCTLDGIPIDQLGPGGAVTVQFAPDGTPVMDHSRALLQSMPVGAYCTLAETEAGGATSVAYGPANPVQVAAAGTTATVTNTFDASSLSVTKTVGGNNAIAHADTAFGFDFGCTFNGLPIGNPPTDPTRSSVFGLIGGASAVFDDLPVGAECAVLEFESRDATSVTPRVDQTATIAAGGVTVAYTNTFDVADVTVTEIVTGPGAPTYGDGQTFFARVFCTLPDGAPAALNNGGRVWLDAGNGFTETIQAPVAATCTATQPRQLATTQTVSAPVTLLLGASHDITIVSDYQLGALTVTKQALGDFSAGQLFGFDTQCTYPGGAPPVNGPRVTGPIPVPLNNNVPNGFSLLSGQDRTVQALADATCTTTETAADAALLVDAVATGSHAISGATSASVVADPAVAGAVRVTNYMPGSLPVTGADTAAALAALGGLLLALGLAALRLRSRERTTAARSPAATIE